MRVAIYVRVSTDEQAKEGFSIPAQRERLRAFCESQGWEIAHEYIEEGWSAKDINRPKMQQMLRDIKKNKFDIVLVYRLDRLTRSVLDLYLLLQTFDGNNVSFRSATEVYDTSTAMGRLFITLVAALAQWERENLAERVKFGIEQMIDEGKKPGGHSPYGYKFDKDFNCEVIEDEANTVQMIFQLYCDGFGYRAIAERLNELNIKPRLAKQWNHNSIRDILMNDMYIGTYRWGGKVIPNNHPPLITDIMFKSAQKVIKGKAVNTSRKGKFMLTGILNCGHCDNNMQGFYDKRDQKTYYRCMKCNRITQDLKILELLIIETHEIITSKEYFLSKIKQQSEESSVSVNINDIEKQISKVQAQREKWYDVYSDENNPIPKEDLFKRINDLNQQEIELQSQLDEIEIPEETPEEKYKKLSQLKDFKLHFEMADDFRKKEMLHSLYEKVIMYRDKGKNKKISLEYYLK